MGLFGIVDMKLNLWKICANCASMAINKVLFVLALASMAIISGPMLKVGGSVQLPHCLVTEDCLPICQKYHCEFCACMSGICFRGCGGKVPIPVGKKAVG